MAAVSGPMEPQVPSALPLSPSRKMVAMKAMPRGIMPAMPKPWTARPIMSQVRLVAKKAIAEPAEKMAMPARMRRRRPTPSLKRP